MYITLDCSGLQINNHGYRLSSRSMKATLSLLVPRLEFHSGFVAQSSLYVRYRTYCSTKTGLSTLKRHRPSTYLRKKQRETIPRLEILFVPSVRKVYSHHSPPPFRRLFLLLLASPVRKVYSPHSSLLFGMFSRSQWSLPFGKCTRLAHLRLF